MRAFMINLIRLYRIGLSPYFGGHCRFHPSCSQYALEAISVHGAFRGLKLALWRLLRCNPFCTGGVDRVPGT
jgi:hypothetical protein